MAPRAAFDLLSMLLPPERKGPWLCLLGAKMKLHKQDVLSCPRQSEVTKKPGSH